MTVGLNRRVSEDCVPSTPLSSEAQEKERQPASSSDHPPAGALLGVAAATGFAP